MGGSVDHIDKLGVHIFAESFLNVCDFIQHNSRDKYDNILIKIDSYTLW